MVLWCISSKVSIVSDICRLEVIVISGNWSYTNGEGWQHSSLSVLSNQTCLHLVHVVHALGAQSEAHGAQSGQCHAVTSDTVLLLLLSVA